MCVNIMRLQYLIKAGAFAWYSVKLALFSVSGLKDEKLIKSKPTWKLKHANFIIVSFEYFCQMSSKSILIISSYTVSNLVHFWDTVCNVALAEAVWPCTCLIWHVLAAAGAGVDCRNDDDDAATAWLIDGWIQCIASTHHAPALLKLDAKQ